MRTNKQNESRRKQFLDAAGALFAARGYEGVSVRDILDEVADKSASPSVFYYYFKSKDDVYRAVLERMTQEYVARLSVMAQSGERLGQKFAAMLSFMRNAVQKDSFAANDSSAENRLFYLDLKERVTQSFVPFWESLLHALPWLSEKVDIPVFAVLAAGAVGELMNRGIKQGELGDREVVQAVTFLLNALCAPDTVRQEILTAVTSPKEV